MTERARLGRAQMVPTQVVIPVQASLLCLDLAGNYLPELPLQVVPGDL